jgi:DNA-binding PadR family transcriptional regulator
MPIQHAVLSLLSQGDSYGYELRTRFEEGIGPQWGSLNVGHLYQILDRLVRDGQATRERIEQDTRPDKYLYRITEAGRAELNEWLAQPQVRGSGYRSELFLKLFAAIRLGPDALNTAIASQREGYLTELAGLADLKRQHKADPLVSLLIESAILHTQADLKITDTAEKRLADIPRHTASPRPTKQPATTRQPRTKSA